MARQWVSASSNRRPPAHRIGMIIELSACLGSKGLCLDACTKACHQLTEPIEHDRLLSLTGSPANMINKHCPLSVQGRTSPGGGSHSSLAQCFRHNRDNPCDESRQSVGPRLSSIDRPLGRKSPLVGRPRFTAGDIGSQLRKFVQNARWPQP